MYKYHYCTLEVIQPYWLLLGFVVVVAKEGRKSEVVQIQELHMKFPKIKIKMKCLVMICSSVSLMQLPLAYLQMSVKFSPSRLSLKSRHSALCLQDCFSLSTVLTASQFQNIFIIPQRNSIL